MLRDPPDQLIAEPAAAIAQEGKEGDIDRQIRDRGEGDEVRGKVCGGQAHPGVLGQGVQGPPHDFAAAGEVVEQARFVVDHPLRQDLAVELTCRQGGARKLFDDAEKALTTAGGPSARTDSLPAGWELGERLLRDRFDLVCVTGG